MPDPTPCTPPVAPGAPPRLALRAREAARALAISERLLWTLTNRGEIPCVRLGRCVTYPVDTLRELLAEKAKGGRHDRPT